MDITIKGIKHEPLLCLLAKLDTVNSTMNESLHTRLSLFNELDKLIRDLNNDVDERYVTSILLEMESVEDEENARKAGLL